jgi:hypothetical protein
MNQDLENIASGVNVIRAPAEVAGGSCHACGRHCRELIGDVPMVTMRKVIIGIRHTMSFVVCDDCWNTLVQEGSTARIATPGVVPKEDLATWTSRKQIIEHQEAVLAHVRGLLLGEKRKLELKMAEDQSPIKIGDVIEWEVGRKGKLRRGRVLSVRQPYSDSFSYGIINLKKDGTEGETAEVAWYMKPRKVFPNS